ncbi:MAG: hypothetical protein QOJ65_1729 [Fimbriimonadaceae bacterium]|nr:hypothetical protein [Fimbriimonadaceae bacterium]
MDVENRLAALGLSLPQPAQVPAGVPIPFRWVRVSGNKAYVSGHIPLDADGSIARPLGRVGAELTVDQGYEAARKLALAMLGSLRNELGDLDRIQAWLRVFAIVNCAPGFVETPKVTNGFSDLILSLYGADKGGHARSTIGGLPAFNAPIEIEAEVEILP